MRLHTEIGLPGRSVVLAAGQNRRIEISLLQIADDAADDARTNRRMLGKLGGNIAQEWIAIPRPAPGARPAGFYCGRDFTRRLG